MLEALFITQFLQLSVTFGQVRWLQYAYWVVAQNTCPVALFPAIKRNYPAFLLDLSASILLSSCICLRSSCLLGMILVGICKYWDRLHRVNFWLNCLRIRQEECREENSLLVYCLDGKADWAEGVEVQKKECRYLQFWGGTLDCIQESFWPDSARVVIGSNCPLCLQELLQRLTQSSYAFYFIPLTMINILTYKSQTHF